MGKQVQLLRGNTTENNNFTGLVGTLTYDTQTKCLRVHDGSTAGGKLIPSVNVMTDYIIAYQLPTSSNSYRWYRKYKSGWVEQGGTNVTVNEQSAVAVTLPITMADTYYTALAQNNTKSTGGNAENGMGIERTSTTQVTLFAHYLEPNTCVASWSVSGKAA